MGVVELTLANLNVESDQVDAQCVLALLITLLAFSGSFVFLSFCRF